MRANFITAAQAAALVHDGATICSVGMTLCGVAESIFKALESSFLATGSPERADVRALGRPVRPSSAAFSTSAMKVMLKRIIGGHWGCTAIMELIGSEKVEAYNIPQGQLTQLYRSMACGLPGKMSKVGLGTYIDPRLEGGKMNARTRALPDIIDVIEYGGEEYLFYKAIPLDFTIFRGTTADEMGNISCEEEAMKLEMIGAVLAAKRFGGKVMAQVKRVARDRHASPARGCLVPGIFVDAVVVCDNPELDHRQSSSFFFDPSLTGDLDLRRRPPWTRCRLSVRKVIGRRAMMELEPGAPINLGTGIPNDVIGPIAAEEGLSHDILVTVESGIYGGLPEGGVDFGVAHSPYALLVTTLSWTSTTAWAVPLHLHGSRRNGCGRQCERHQVRRPPHRLRRLYRHHPERPSCLLLLDLYRARTGGRLLRRQADYRQGGQPEKARQKGDNRSRSTANWHAARARRSTLSPSGRSSSCGGKGRS